MEEFKQSIENKVNLDKHSSQNNDNNEVDNEIKLLKEEKEENIKKIEIIEAKIAKLNFEQRELKELIDENWKMTDRNRDKHEKADAQLKLLEVAHATVKATISENQISQNNTNDNLKILQAKITTLSQNEAQSQGLPTNDERNVKCAKCNEMFADKRQLTQHNKTNHRKKIVCRICEQQFEENFELEEHLINEHKKSKGYKCSKCECSFILKWRLKRHVGVGCFIISQLLKLKMSI